MKLASGLVDGKWRLLDLRFRVLSREDQAPSLTTYRKLDLLCPHVACPPAPPVPGTRVGQCRGWLSRPPRPRARVPLPRPRPVQGDSNLPVPGTRHTSSGPTLSPGPSRVKTASLLL